MRDLKYLLAYLVPVTAYFSIQWGGAWSYFTVAFAFGLIPLLEPFTGRSTQNLSIAERSEKLKAKFFDWLLYLNVPIVGFIFYLFTRRLEGGGLELYEVIGMTLSTGIVAGSSGINVAHELGHRKNVAERFMAWLLLLPSFYMHFYIEHNRGHHKNVSTPLDPASAQKGENLYRFWIRSTTGSYLNAWRIQKQLLAKSESGFFSFKNEMLFFHLVELVYILSIGFMFGIQVLGWVMLSGVIGFLLLETINYVEHYGLRRQLLPSGNYEPVKPRHSWNANQELGRIMLYELTRHSDHHYLASKKYQVLDHHEESPQLPAGYPTCMLMALMPPLWFSVMDKRISTELGVGN